MQLNVGVRSREYVCRASPLPPGEGSGDWPFFTPEACMENSRGLSEQQRAQPPVDRNQEDPHSERVRGILALFQSATFGWFVFRWYARTTRAYHRLISLHASGVRKKWPISSPLPDGEAPSDLLDYKRTNNSENARAPRPKTTGISLVDFGPRLSLDCR